MNSENRAKQIRKEIEKRLGARATHESTLAQTLDEMRKNAPPDADEAELHDAEMEALLADLEARKLPQATLQMQVESWAHWVHQKIAASGGRTPLEAVHDPDGKEMVEALVPGWERSEGRSVSPNQVRPDISALRRLLHLAPQVS